MSFEIIRLSDEERHTLVEVARAMLPFEEELAAAWMQSYEQRNALPDEDRQAINDYLGAVRLFLTSLSDNDFGDYFRRIVLKGEVLAQDRRSYEDFIMSFHLFEEITMPHLFRLFPERKTEVLSALDHLYHNDIALLARAFFQEQEREREKFYHILTHDLKNPLSSILCLTDLLLDNSEGEQREMVETIQNGAHSIREMIESTMAYGRLKHGSVRIQRERFDLCALGLEQLLQVRPKAQERGVRILYQQAALESYEYRLDPEFTLVGDRSLIARAMLNFLSNAAKYARGRMALEIRRCDAKLWVGVQDDGPGISPEHQRRVFEDYFQVPGSLPGTGLGLPSARRVAEVHNGRVGVEATPGEGSLFWMELPVS